MGYIPMSSVSTDMKGTIVSGLFGRGSTSTVVWYREVASSTAGITAVREHSPIYLTTTSSLFGSGIVDFEEDIWGDNGTRSEIRYVGARMRSLRELPIRDNQAWTGWRGAPLRRLRAGEGYSRQRPPNRRLCGGAHS